MNINPNHKDAAIAPELDNSKMGLQSRLISVIEQTWL